MHAQTLSFSFFPFPFFRFSDSKVSKEKKQSERERERERSEYQKKGEKTRADQKIDSSILNPLYIFYIQKNRWKRKREEGLFIPFLVTLSLSSLPPLVFEPITKQEERRREKEKEEGGRNVSFMTCSITCKVGEKRRRRRMMMRRRRKDSASCLPSCLILLLPLRIFSLSLSHSRIFSLEQNLTFFRQEIASLIFVRIELKMRENSIEPKFDFED